MAKGGAMAKAVESIDEVPVGAAGTDLLLLAPVEIQFELRRLIRRMAEGACLLSRGRSSVGTTAPGSEVLLDLEVDGIRCLLTRRDARDSKGVARLTTREREVAHMVGMGLTTSAIAGKLEVSPWTVSTHLRRIFAKLGVSTRAAMVAVISER
jgi:DNA-binding CsgD family transcriptional regulator